MKHAIQGRTLRHPYVYLEVELLPENESEQKAIVNVRNISASDSEKELLDNYLTLRLNAVDLEWGKGNFVTLKSTAV